MKKIYDGIIAFFGRIHSAYQLRSVKRGQKNNVFGKIAVVNRRNLKIGSGNSFNHNAYINAFNPVILGDDVTVSAGAKIVSTGIDYISWMKGNKRHLVNGGIVIGDHVWIGADAMILGNVKITGHHVVIAAGALVTKDIHESRVVVAGSPAVIIKRFGEDGEPVISVEN